MVTMEKTLNITEEDLHSSLNDFLEEKEKKPAESIWNFTTISGLILVLISAAYVGNSVGSALFGLSTLPMITTLMKITPYFGGALLGVIILSTIRKKNRSESVVAERERDKAKQTYDKLDEFLYQDEIKSKKKPGTRDKSFKNFSVGNSQKLSRSRTDKKLAGVCGGLAKHLGMSSTVLRLIFVAALFLSFNTFILVYIALAFVMPKEPVSEMDEFL